MKNDKDIILRFDEKLDKVTSSINQINITLAEQHISLKEHMKRSDLLEKHFDLLEKKTETIEKRQFMAQGVFKFFGFIAVLAGILEGISVFLELISKK